jgi:tetratricopeptide (TPR) repeat protein
MKVCYLILIMLLPQMIIAQQSSIVGTVSIFNSQFETGKRQYVANALIEDENGKALPTYTDSLGNFKLIFVSLGKGEAVILSIKKAGLEVVNADNLTVVVGQRDAIKISMAKPGEVAEYRKKLYNIGKSQAENALETQLNRKSMEIAALQKSATTNTKKIQQLQKEYIKLQTYLKTLQEQAQDLARRYAPINLDDAAPLYRESFGYFQQGNLEKAMKILRGADLIGQADKILAERKSIDKIRQDVNERDSLYQQRAKDLLQTLVLKADLHQTRFEWDSTLFCFELLIELDSSSYTINFDFATFLDKQNDIRAKKRYFYALGSTSKTADKINIMDRLGIYLLKLYDYNGADSLLSNSLTIREQLYFVKKLNIVKAINNQDEKIASQYAESLNSISFLYRRQGKFKEAIEKLEKALKIYEELAVEKPDIYEPKAAKTRRNLANAQRGKSD